MAQYATLAQRRTLIAASLGWMLDVFDVMLYSIVLPTLLRTFGMSKTTAGLLNTLTLVASAIGSFGFGFAGRPHGAGTHAAPTVVINQPDRLRRW